MNERKVAVYDRIHELHEIFTADGASTQLHACDKDVRHIFKKSLIITVS